MNDKFDGWLANYYWLGLLFIGDSRISKFSVLRAEKNKKLIFRAPFGPQNVPNDFEEKKNLWVKYHVGMWLQELRWENVYFKV